MSTPQDVQVVNTALPISITSSATSIAKDEDAASANGDTGAAMLAVRKATPANTSGADGDYEFLQMSAGRLWTSAMLEAGSTTAVTQGTATNLKTQAECYQGGSAVAAGNPLQVTLANGSVPSHAVTNAGTFAVQESGAALTSLQLIDDTIATTASAITSKGVAVSGTDGTNARVLKTDTSGELQVDVLTLPTLAAVTTVSTVTNQSQEGGVNISLNAGAVDTGTRRVVQANGAGKTILSAGGSASSSGNNTLIAAGTNRLKVKAFSLTTTSTTAMTCIFQSGAGGTELWRVVIQAPSGASAGANLTTTAPDWLFATASATLLNLNLSSANAVHWSVSYYDEA